ncbi:MAG: hypothetical protein KGL35_29075, partial [Bradyrhizobium sp.]|nr:hypothetical protein [Bradyrhizobium sp.]
TVLQFGNANSVITRVEADAFAAAAHFSGLRSEGTAASPTAVAAGSEIVRLGAGGYNGAAWIVGAGGLRVFANPSGSTWTTGDNGTYADIAVTAPGATSLTQVAKFSSSSIVFPAGGVMIGLNTPTAPLTITTQTGTLPTPSIGGTIIHAIGADGSNSGVELDAFQNGGSNVQGIVGFRGANGTLASPSALTAANGSIGAFNWFGYNGSAYVQGGRIRGLTSENWGASNGFHFDFGTVAAGSTSVATAMSIYGGVVIGSGTTDPGAGNLSVGGNVTVNGNGIASTSTDAVILANGTAATSGAQAQWSPRVHLQGQGWASTPAASQTVDLISELQIAGGTTAPTGALVWSAQTAGGG